MGNLLKETPHSETNATLEVLDRFGVTRFDLERLRANNGEFGRLVADFIKTGPSVVTKPIGTVTEAISTVTNRSKLLIDRDVPCKKRIAATKLDRISDHFVDLPTGEPIERELGLLKMGRNFNLEEAEIEAGKHGFEFATMEDGVAYVTAFPQLQRWNTIVVAAWTFLPTVRSRGLVVPTFGDDGDGERCLGFSDVGNASNRFVQSCSVLVRRKTK